MAQQNEDLSVLTRWVQWNDAPNSLYHHLMDQAVQLLDERAERVATLETKGQWLKRQEKGPQTLMKIVGPFPERTPLNPRIMDVLQKNGYRVEKWSASRSQITHKLLCLGGIGQNKMQLAAEECGERFFSSLCFYGENY